MRLVQPILVIIFCVGTWLYFRLGQARRLDRLMMVLLILAGVVMILDPELTTNLANLLGVSRGTDLVLYFGLTLLGFGGLFLYSKQRSVEARLTDFVRAMAIQEAFDRLPPVDSTGTPPNAPTE